MSPQGRLNRQPLNNNNNASAKSQSSSAKAKEL